MPSANGSLSQVHLTDTKRREFRFYFNIWTSCYSLTDEKRLRRPKEDGGVVLEKIYNFEKRILKKFHKNYLSVNISPVNVSNLLLEKFIDTSWLILLKSPFWIRLIRPSCRSISRRRTIASMRSLVRLTM